MTFIEHSSLGHPIIDAPVDTDDERQRSLSTSRAL
jgi:hypothetical protein